MSPARALAAALAALLLAAAPAASPAADEVRALWVVRTTMTSPASIAAMVTRAKRAGFTTLIVQVRGRGDAYYHSRHEPRSGALSAQRADFDPLAVVLREAGTAGLQVHAWVNVNLVADAADLPASRKHVVHRHPEWLMLPAVLAGADPSGSRFLSSLASWTRAHSDSVEGLYTSPIPGPAADHVVEVVRDLASHYAVDGMHFDYVRYPGPSFDYSRQALRAFRDEMAPRVARRERDRLDRLLRSRPAAWVERFPDRWGDFRRERLTALVRRLRSAVLTKRPGAMISAAVVPDSTLAVTDRLQEWPAWAGEGLIDTVCPMVYTDDVATFQRQLVRARELAGEQDVWAGIGAYRLTDQQTLQHITVARDAGADGIALFSYDSLIAPSRGAGTLRRIGQQAFGK